MSTPARARVPTVDALRAAALLGVIVVNAAGYTLFPDSGHIVPPPTPPDSPLAASVQWLVIALLQGKAYTLLSFLFGLGFALSLRQRSDDALAHRRRRMARLMLIGLAHGLLLYAGDVLTVYAIAGFLLLRGARLRLRRLLGRLRVWAAVAVLCILAQVVLLHTMGSAADAQGARSYAGAATWGEFVSLGASRFLGISIGIPLVLPQIVTLMLAGQIAGRLRLLTHRRWRAAAARLAARAVPLGLLLNGALAAVVLQAGAPVSAAPHPWTALFGLVGPVLSLGFAAAVVARPGALACLAPAGRLTLTMYLVASLAMAICLGGPGLGWQFGSVGTLVFGLGLYALLLGAAIIAARLGWGAPLERWLSR